MEVLVSLAILGVGIGGVMATQTMGLRNNQSAYFRTQADILLSDMGERMRNNAIAARAGSYAMDWSSDYSAAADCIQKRCHAEEIRSYDLSEWTAIIHQSLPAGEGKITALSGETYLIEIRWQDKGSRGVASAACGREMFCMAVQVQI